MEVRRLKEEARRLKLKLRQTEVNLRNVLIALIVDSEIALNAKTREERDAAIRDLDKERKYPIAALKDFQEVLASVLIQRTQPKPAPPSPEPPYIQ
jgi:hypothetical protein